VGRSAGQHGHRRDADLERSAAATQDARRSSALATLRVVGAALGIINRRLGYQRRNRCMALAIARMDVS